MGTFCAGFSCFCSFVRGKREGKDGNSKNVKLFLRVYD